MLSESHKTRREAAAGAGLADREPNPGYGEDEARKLPEKGLTALSSALEGAKVLQVSIPSLNGEPRRY